MYFIPGGGALRKNQEQNLEGKGTKGYGKGKKIKKIFIFRFPVR